MTTAASTHSENGTKVVLDPLPFNEVLHKQTLNYWRISQAWNGYGNESLTIADAFDTFNDILCECNPARPLAIRVNNLKGLIIEYGSKSKMRKAANTNAEPILTVL